MSKIQRIPSGLLDALGITGGRTPADLAEVVAGTLDLLDFYSSNRMESVSAVETGIAPSVGSTRSTIDIPLGETWWVRHIGSIAENFTANATFLMKPFIRVGGVGRGIRFGINDASITGTTTEDITVNAPVNMFFPPGSQLGTVVEQTIGAGTVQLVTEAIIVRFRV